MVEELSEGERSELETLAQEDGDLGIIARAWIRVEERKKRGSGGIEW